MTSQINWEEIVAMFKIKANQDSSFKCFYTKHSIFYIKNLDNEEFEVGYYLKGKSLNECKVTGEARYKIFKDKAQAEMMFLQVLKQEMARFEKSEK